LDSSDLLRQSLGGIYTLARGYPGRPPFFDLHFDALQLRVHRERRWIRIFPRVCRWGYVSGALSPIPRDEQVGFDAMPSPLREVAISDRAHCDAAGQNLDIAAREVR